MKGLIIVISSVVAAVVLIVAGVNYFVLNKPSPAESPAEEATPAAPVTTPPQSEPTLAPPPPSLEQQIATVREAIAGASATTGSKEVTLVITEAEANDLAAKLLVTAEIPEDIPLEIRAVHVDFKTGNNVFLDVETTALGFNVTIQVKSQVSLKEGKPAVEVTAVNFGIVPLPDSLKQRITDFVGQKSEELYEQLVAAELGSDRTIDLEFKEINIQEETATATVIIKPRA